MKVRIQGSRLRYRLKQFEVAAFKEDHVVKDELRFGDHPQECIQFTLEATSDQKISADFECGKISVKIPHHVANKWTDTDMVGLEETVISKQGKSIYILIEKDFECI